MGDLVTYLYKYHFKIINNIDFIKYIMKLPQTYIFYNDVLMCVCVCVYGF